jgi:hypothetical protein
MVICKLKFFQCKKNPSLEVNYLYQFFIQFVCKLVVCLIYRRNRKLKMLFQALLKLENFWLVENLLFKVESLGLEFHWAPLNWF